MGQFFRPAGDDTLWVYSERGLLAYLFHVLLRQDQGIALILNNAVNKHGATLAATVGNVEKHRLLTEHSLGSDGFGCPDGGVFLGDANGFERFVFVEGKRERFLEEFIAPRHSTEVLDDLRDLGRQAVRKKIKGFSSSINGQLELRWRFVNALRSTKDAEVVSELASRPSIELQANDVFYLRYDFRPDPNNRTHWRSVDMRTDLRCFQDLLRPVNDFYLLAITADAEFPRGMDSIRLFDASGQRLAGDSVLFWMPLDVVRRVMDVSERGLWPNPRL